MSNANTQGGRLIIVGDLFPVKANFEFFSKGDVQSLFGKEICDLFASADYRICNLEGALTDSSERCVKTGPSYIAPTSTVKAIKALGIDCCTLANNHITDAGHSGVIDTIRTLENWGIHHLGAGENSEAICSFHSIEISGTRVGLYNVAETMYNAPSKTSAGAHLYDEYLVCKELESYKRQCDYLIVIYHGGIEKYRYPSPEIRKRFHRMADSGANMVLSQHTHCIGCEEYYNDSYLLYGQGNFLFKSFVKGLTDSGLILEIEFKDNGVRIAKHIVNAIENCVEYDKKQDFTEYAERSLKLNDVNFLNEQFRVFSYSELFRYLIAFKGKDPCRAVAARLFPSKYKKFLLFHSYSKYQLLYTLHTLRSEQNRETAMEGILALLECLENTK